MLNKQVFRQRGEFGIDVNKWKWVIRRVGLPWVCGRPIAKIKGRPCDISRNPSMDGRFDLGMAFFHQDADDPSSPLELTFRSAKAGHPFIEVFTFTQLA